MQGMQWWHWVLGGGILGFAILGVVGIVADMLTPKSEGK